MKHLILISTVFMIIILLIIPGGRTQFMKHQIKGNGSCLFSAIQYVMWQYEPQLDEMNLRLRIQAGSKVVEDPEPGLFDGALADLNMTAREYATFIAVEGNWGGAIDIIATALDYQTEIVVLDLPKKARHTFGECRGYERRVFLLYDSDHYDALYQLIPNTDAEGNILSYSFKTLFDTDDDWSYGEAQRLARKGSPWKEPLE